MKAVITGATGFVGGHLTERLLDEGFEVRCLVREGSRTEDLKSAGAEICIASLFDTELLSELVSGADLLFHVAGLTRSRTIPPYMRINGEGTGNLVDAAINAPERPGRFIYISSLAAVGPNPACYPVDEGYSPKPLKGYGESKLAGEIAVRGAADKLPVTVIRPPAVYGPRDMNFLPMFKAAGKYGFVPVIGDPDKEVSMVYITDLIDGIMVASTCDQAEGETYFITSSDNTFSEIATAVGDATGSSARPLSIPPLIAKIAGEIGEMWWRLTNRSTIISRRKVKDMLQPRWTCSSDKAIVELGYSPQISLKEGMKLTARWYIENGML